MNFDRSKVERVRRQYPVGTRIRLNSLCNDERDNALNIALRANCRVSLDREAVAFCSAKVPENSLDLCGTVVGVDDQPALLMKWDNGSSLSLFPGEDSFSVVQPEMEQQDGFSEQTM